MPKLVALGLVVGDPELRVPFRQEIGEPLHRGERLLAVHVHGRHAALLIPPGIPDFLTRTRLVQAGPVRLVGRAWAGRQGVARVDVSTDGGATWQETKLDAPLSPFAWRPWSCTWQARPGRTTLCAQARAGRHPWRRCNAAT